MAERLLDESFPATPEAVSLGRHAVAAVLRGLHAAETVIGAVTLAVSEAFTNAVLHAYLDREPGEVHVHLDHAGDEIEVVVSDDGGGMRPRLDSPGAGLGLPLISQVADHLDVANVAGGGTRLSMRFALD